MGLSSDKRSECLGHVVGVALCLHFMSIASVGPKDSVKKRAPVTDESRKISQKLYRTFAQFSTPITTVCSDPREGHARRTRYVPKSWEIYSLLVLMGVIYFNAPICLPRAVLGYSLWPWAGQCGSFTGTGLPSLILIKVAKPDH